MKIEIWHNIMWSRYKARVFTELQNAANSAGDTLKVYQIAATESDRVALGAVVQDLHEYNYELLFNSTYSDIPRWSLFSKIYRITRSSRADVTFLAGYERAEYWLQLLILMLKKRRRAVFCDSTSFDREPTYLKSIAKRFFFSNVHAVFCYGERSAEYARGHGARRTIQRYQAAWLPETYDAKRIPALRAERRSPNGPVFLYVGRVSPEKRIDTLILAFKKVLEKEPAATLRIVGKGPAEAELKQLAASLGITESVIFTGAQSGSALMDEYLAATCFVLPSWSEPWGLVVNEALHHGCPVVVSHRCGCVPELVEKSVCGRTFNCGDADDLAAKLLEFVSIDEERLATARMCLEKIAPYTPQAAAEQILGGARALQGL